MSWGGQLGITGQAAWVGHKPWMQPPQLLAEGQEGTRPECLGLLLSLHLWQWESQQCPRP